jgi:hypothetical protein
MAPQLSTFRDAAEAFCKLDGRPESDISAVYLQVKGLYDRGLLSVSPTRAARGANQITLKEMCRARLLLVLIDLGIESEDLARANAMLDSGGKWTSPTGTHFSFSLDGLLKACRNGDRWVLRVNMARDHLKGALTFSVKLLPNWMAARPVNVEHSDGDPTHPDSNADFLGHTHLAYLKIPASDLVSPLLKNANA